MTMLIRNTETVVLKFCTISILQICKNENITLLIYDYNEPCCGKDQCDMESAAAKSLLRSFVDAGNTTTSK